MPKKRTALVTRQCEHCGADFEAWRGEVRRGGGRFCNQECHRAFKTVPITERYWRHAVPATGCWGWLGATNSAGYGIIQRGRQPSRPVQASRVSWEIHFGPIPDGLWVLHRCDNPPCSNPNHLFLGSHDDNVADKVAKGRQPRGEHTGHAKLTDSQVVEIRARWASGQVRQQKHLAAEYGVSTSTICTILSRKTRSHAD